MKSQLKRGILELCVFASLNKEDCYGYKLVQDISQSIQVSEGTIYPLLKRLRDDGFVDTYYKESTKGPPQKYYFLTKRGHDEMMKQLDEFTEFIDGMKNILMRGGLIG